MKKRRETGENSQRAHLLTTGTAAQVLRGCMAINLSQMREIDTRNNGKFTARVKK